MLCGLSSCYDCIQIRADIQHWHESPSPSLFSEVIWDNYVLVMAVSYMFSGLLRLMHDPQAILLKRYINH